MVGALVTASSCLLELDDLVFPLVDELLKNSRASQVSQTLYVALDNLPRLREK